MKSDQFYGGLWAVHSPRGVDDPRRQPGGLELDDDDDDGPPDDGPLKCTDVEGADG